MNFLRLDDFTVPGYGLLTALALKFKDEDASGDSSSTATAGKGTKGKRLECKIYIRFKDDKDLRALIRVAEATIKDDNKVYTVTNSTANAAGMRQATFTGDFRADEQEGLRCWLVSFTLLEHISVPERVEARAAKKQAKSTQNTGQAVTPPPAEEQPLSPFEKWLKEQSDRIGGFGG